MLSGPSESEVDGKQADHHSIFAMSPGADALENMGLIWGDTDDGPHREWSKLNEEFSNAGYREGITAGKESALQEGFDDGFANVGAPLGRDIGLLRGVASAALSLISSHMHYSDSDVLQRHRNEVQSIIGSLGRIHISDLAPRDLQAEEHAKEHLDPGTQNDSLISYGLDSDHVVATWSENNQVKPAVEELDRLRALLSNVLQEIGFNIPLR